MSFQPTQIPGCQLWLDGADSAATILSGSNVSQWNDKSGNGYNFTQVGSFALPTISSNAINSLNAVSFTGTNIQNNLTNQILTNSSFPLNSSTNGYSIFAITRQNASHPSYTSYNYILSAYGVANNGAGILYGTNPSNFFLTANGTAGPLGGFNDLTANTPNTLMTNNTLTCIVVTTNLLTPYLNGSVMGTKTGTSGAVTGVSVGNAYAPGPQFVGQAWGGVIGEIVIFSVSLNDLQRQQTEGYLAWKWGLQASLPATHPYKNFPPTSLVITNPTEINLVNTAAQSGTIPLPSTNNLFGRLLSFKDSQGTWQQSTLTLSTIGALDRFETNTNVQTLGESYGFINLAAGENRRWYQLGGSQLNTITTSTLNTNVLNSLFISTGNATVSTLNLVDQFFTTTSNQVRQSTTFLLYGNQILRGTGTASGTLTLRTSGFSPLQIAGLSLWYDATDSSSYTAVGGVVSSWSSKGANTTAVTQATASNRPQIASNVQAGLNVMRFTNAASVNYVNLNNAAVASNILSTSNSCFLFIVHNPTRQNNTCFSYTSATNRMSFTTPEVITGTNFVQWDYPNGTTGRVSTAQPASYITEGFKLECAYASNGASGSNGYRKNGALLGTRTGVNATGFSATNSLVIGGFNATQTTYFYRTDIGEIVLFNQPISDLAIQQVEGYLAWKWGLQTLLPTTHAFYYGPP